MRNRVLIVCLVMLVLLGGCTRSKKLFSLAGLEAMSPLVQPVNVAEYEAKYGDYDGVYIRSERIIEHAGGKDPGAMTLLFNAPPTWNYQEITREKYIVFNPDADWLTTFSVWTKPDHCYLRITNPDGTHREYGLLDLQVEKDSYGGKDYRFIFPDVKRGSIIETGYALEFRVGINLPPLEHEILLQHSIPADSVVFTYACPEWWSVELKKNSATAWPTVEMTVDEKSKKKVIKALRADVPAIKIEDYAPYFKDMADYVQFQVTKMEIAGIKYEAPDAWDDIGKYYRKKVVKKLDDDASWEVKQRTQIMIGTIEEPMEKVIRILQFVRDSIELDGKSRSGNPDKVLKDRKADIYDLTALAGAMLTEAGISNDYLLVHSGLDGYCDMNYISGRQFYFPALGARVGSEYFTLFPFIKGLQPGVVPPWFLGQPAITLNQGVSGATVSDSCQVQNGIFEVYDLTIADDGLITVKEEREFQGANAFLARDSLYDLSKAELETTVKGMLTYTDGNVSISSFEVIDLKDPNVPLRILYEYTIDNLVTVTPEEVLFRTAGLFSPISGAKLIDDPAERVNEVVVGHPENYSKSVRIRYPESWQLTTLLHDVEATNDFGNLRGAYTLEPGLITVEQDIHLNRLRMPRETYGEFLEIAGTKSDLYVPTMVFSVGSGDRTPAELPAEAEMQPEG